ncbi:NACHT domain-containing protein [Streptomyces sp. NPDC005900]|uniref:NACHT domain-containing protein n=1 Tax=Streptomyces sp. NPDC005900 TaxID=3154569 RepID=UPI0033CA8559
MGAVIATGVVAAAAARNGFNATGPLVSVLGFFVALAGLVHSTSSPSPTSRLDEQLDPAADALARAVREQWQAEWRLRRLQDPEPLPIHWAPAAAWLSDLDDTMSRPPAEAQRPDFFGHLSEIVQLYELVPSHRLVVLGAPGSGKTVLAMRFTLGLLERRSTGDPVPVLFQASTWQPDRQSLREWLADDLIATYPTLGVEGTAGSVPARDLVATGRILPVIDGLDEMPPPLRAKAVWRLNTELDGDSPLLVTCRSAVYGEVVAVGDVLTSAAVIEIQPLGFEEAARYLIRTARPQRGPGGQRATVWDPVLDEVRRAPDAPSSRCLRQVLSLPLMVAMARAVYGDTGANPTELLHHRDLAAPAALEQHLLDAFVPASFRTSTRYDEAQAVHWLRFLARHLQRRGTRDLAWWELHWALPGLARTVGPLLLVGAVAEVVCLALWLAGASAQLPVTGAAIVLGLCVAHAVLSRNDITPRRKLLLSIACVVPLGVVIGGFRSLSEKEHSITPFADLSALLGYLTAGALYGVSLATVLAVIGVTRMPAPATMPFPAMDSKRYGRWVWKGMSGLLVGPVVYAPFYMFSAKTPVLVAVAIIGVLVGAYVVRGRGASAVYSGGSPGARRRPRAFNRFGRALLQGLSVGLITGIALGLVFSLTAGGTAAARAAARNDFPVSGPVHRSLDGGRYVVADDGTRYGVRPDGDRYIKQSKPRKWSVWEYPAGRIVVFDSGFKECRKLAECHVIRTAVEVSVDFAPTELSPYIVRLPDGRFAMWAEPPASILEGRQGHWMTRQEPGRLLGTSLSFGILISLALGLAAGVAAGLHRWLGAPVDTARTPTPLASLLADRDTGVVRGFLITVVGTACIIPLVFLSAQNFDLWLIALSVILPTGLIALALSAWGRLLTVRLSLCPPGRLPWHLMAFLAEAHERGVLRQAGAIYQFRHARLQERLASAQEEDQER